MHPTTVHIFKLWQTFLENVNPLVKVLHAPTVQQQILKASSDLASISKETEALMFSVYCVALISMSAEDVEKELGESKAVLWSKYRQGARLALSNADLLRTSSLTVLQAFFLYLVCSDNPRDKQTLTCLDVSALHAGNVRFSFSLVLVRSSHAHCTAYWSPSRW